MIKVREKKIRFRASKKFSIQISSFRDFFSGLFDRPTKLNVNFQRFPTLDAKKLVNAPKMSAHHRGICHF